MSELSRVRALSQVRKHAALGPNHPQPEAPNQLCSKKVPRGRHMNRARLSSDSHEVQVSCVTIVCLKSTDKVPTFKGSFGCIYTHTCIHTYLCICVYIYIYIYILCILSGLFRVRIKVFLYNKVPLCLSRLVKGCTRVLQYSLLPSDSGVFWGFAESLLGSLRGKAFGFRILTLT